jgi:hypothetical protein
MRIKMFATALTLSSGMAYAGAIAPPPPAAALAGNSATQTRAFAGLNWAFGAGPSQVEGVVGVARVRTKANNQSRGIRASVNFGLVGGFTFQSVRVTGMFGRNNAMGEVGVGYGPSGAFGTTGLWVPYANIGANLSFAGDLSGYAGLHSMGKWTGPGAVAGPVAPPLP